MVQKMVLSAFCIEGSSLRLTNSMIMMIITIIMMMMMMMAMITMTIMMIRMVIYSFCTEDILADGNNDDCNEQLWLDYLMNR